MSTLTPQELMQRDGYVLYPGLFSKEEIERLRTSVRSYFNTGGRYFQLGKFQPDAFAKIPDIRWACCHKPLLDAFRECTGIDDLRYTFHSDVHMNSLSQWHTDTQAYFDPKEVLVDDFHVYKAGIYLQDHLDNGRGLTVCDGSHKTGVIEKEHVNNIRTRAGDVIIFDVRLYHHGDLANMFERALNKVVKRGDLNFKIGRVVRTLTNRDDKLSLFFTFGQDNNHTQEFSRRNMARQNKQNGTTAGIEKDEHMVQLLSSSQVRTVEI